MLMSASNLINHNINSNCYGVETPLKNYTGGLRIVVQGKRFRNISCDDELLILFGYQLGKALIISGSVSCGNWQANIVLITLNESGNTR